MGARRSPGLTPRNLSLRFLFGDDQKEELLVELSRRTIAETDADVIIFGGAPLAGLAEKVKDRIAVPVVDQVFHAWSDVPERSRDPGNVRRTRDACVAVWQHLEQARGDALTFGGYGLARENDPRSTGTFRVARLAAIWTARRARTAAMWVRYSGVPRLSATLSTLLMTRRGGASFLRS